MVTPTYPRRPLGLRLYLFLIWMTKTIVRVEVPFTSAPPARSLSGSAWTSPTVAST